MIGAGLTGMLAGGLVASHRPGHEPTVYVYTAISLILAVGVLLLGLWISRAARASAA
jgi:hypothetical protein